MTQYVFDTSALLTFIENEAGAEVIEELLIQALEKEHHIFVSAVTLIERLYFSTRTRQNHCRAAFTITRKPTFATRTINT